MKADDLRRRVLDASLALIGEKGLEGFSMREVARRAGVSHQAPYHHFPDREAILAAIVAEGFARLRDSSRAAFDAEPNAARRLTALGGAYIDFALANPAHFKLMFRSEWVRAEKHDDARACAAGAFDVLAEAARAVSPNDPTLILTAWSLAHGLATLLLEGKLERIASGAPAQRAAARAALSRFQSLVSAEARAKGG